MEREHIIGVAGIVAFSAAALYVALMQIEPRAQTKSFIFQAPEQEQRSEAGASPSGLPPQAAEDADTSLLQSDSPASGAGLHLSPSDSEPNAVTAPAAQPDRSEGVLSPAGGAESPLLQPMAVDPASPAGLFSDPQWAPSRENFLNLSSAIYRALDLTLAEAQEVDERFWYANPSYAYLLRELPIGSVTLREYFQIEDPRLALEHQWTEPGTEALWRTHMQLFRQQHIGHQTSADLGLTQKRLFEIRDAIWSGVSPAHQFLFRLDQETR